MSAERRDIPGYVGYAASADGRVWSRRRRVARKHLAPGEVRLGDSWRELKPSPDAHGYRVVNLIDADGVQRQHKVHLLILAAFVGPRPLGTETRHLNGIRHDNRLANLAYGSAAENAEDRASHGTIPAGESHSGARLTAAKVQEIRRLYRAGGITQEQLGARFGVNNMTVNDVLRGRTWRSVPDDQAAGLPGDSR